VRNLDVAENPCSQGTIAATEDCVRLTVLAAPSILAEIVQVRKSKTAWVEQKEIAGVELAKADAKDPVCGMLFDASEPKYISDYRGETYYFCCAGCKQAFDKQPEAYLSSVVSDL
jgi:YHS domain-containing protein